MTNNIKYQWITRFNIIKIRSRICEGSKQSFHFKAQTPLTKTASRSSQKRKAYLNDISNKKILFLTILSLFFSFRAFAQSETEPNNSAIDAGIQRIWEGTTISGSVSSTDVDFWNVSKLPGTDPQVSVILGIVSGYNPATMKVEFETRTGGFDGPVAVPFQDARLVTAGLFSSYPSIPAGSYFVFNDDTNDTYLVLRVTTASATPVNYSLELRSEDFPTCAVPANAGGLTTTQTGANSLRLDAFSAVSNITGGYVVEISDSPTFSALPDPQFDALTDLTPSTAYSGSGQQIIYASPTPSRLSLGFETPTVPVALNVTGLDPNTTYYFRVTTANECNGYFNFSSGATISGTTCGAAPNQVTGITTANNFTNSFDISSFTAPSGGADGYVIKVNKTNSFTAPANGALPPANTTYNLATGEQVVYAGTSTSPNVTVTGAGVTAGSTFYVQVYSYFNCAGVNYFESVGTNAVRGICNGAPNVTPSPLLIDQVSHSSMRVNSTSGAGGAIGQVILVNTVNSFTPPLPGPLPAANTVYAGSGQQVIYRGSDVNPAVTVTNLTNANGGTQYFFKSYAYDPCGTNFYFESTGVETNATTCGATQNLAGNAVILEVGNTFMDFSSFSPAAGATGYVVKMNTINSFSPPADGLNSLPAQSTNYGGGEQVIYAGTSNMPNIRITGLSAATTYHFTVYAYTTCDGAIFYQQNGYNFSQQNVKPAPTINFADFAKTFGDPNFNLLATSNSTGALTYSVVSQTTSGTSVTGSTVTIGNVGMVVFQVDQAATAAFNPGSAQATMTINKADPAINFSNQTVAFGTGDVTLTATSNSTGAITYSIVGDANGNVLSGNILTPGNAGTIIIQASQAADANFNAATRDIFFSVSAPSEIFGIDESGVFRLVNETTFSYLVDFATNGTVTGTGVGELLLANGKYWGVTSDETGSATFAGSIFNMNTDGTGFTKVHDFNLTTEGGGPTGLLTLSNGKIWGLLTFDGPGSGTAGASGNFGSIFSINTDGTNFTVVRGFSFVPGSTELIGPDGGLTEANGRIWGVARFDGTNFAGAIYSIGTDGTGFRVDHVFASQTSNSQPIGRLTLTNNQLWGTTTSGGGSIFSINTDGTGFTTVHDFGSSGTGPFDGLTVVGNQLFGTIGSGGANSTGTLFRINDDGTGFTTLYDWPATGINSPSSELTADGNTLYGITSAGGANNVGSIYRIGTDGLGYQDVRENAVQTGSGKLLISRQRLTPSLTFGNQTVQHLSVTNLVATTNSTGAITYSLVGDITGSSLANDQFTAGNTGTVTIRASLAQDQNFEAATVDATFTIVLTDPTFTISDIIATYRDADITFSPTTNYSGSTITYQFVDPGNNNNLATTGFNTASTIVGNTLTVGTPGMETIRATLPANSNFNTATFDFQLTINEAVTDLSPFVNISRELFEADFQLVATNEPNVAIDYQLLTSNTGTTISGNTVTLGNTAGVEIIRATVTEPNYVADTRDITLTLSRATPVLTWPTPADLELGQPLTATQLNANANVPGTFVYQFMGLDDPENVVPGSTSFATLGAQTLTAIFTPTDGTNYQAASINVNINIVPIELEITADDFIIAVGVPDPTLTFTITNGSLLSGHSINVPLMRAAGTIAGDYAITVDPNVATDTGDPFNFPVCASGICIFDPNDIFNSSRLSNYNITFVPGTLTISDKTPATLTLNSAELNATFDGTAQTVNLASVVETASGNPITPQPTINFSYSGTDATGMAYGPSAIAPTNAGTYTVTASIDANDPTYIGTVSGTLEIAQATATAIISDLNQVADGMPKAVTVVTTPPVIADLEITYEGRAGTNYPISTTPPSAAGRYQVSVQINGGTGNNYNFDEDPTTFVREVRGDMQLFERIPLSITLNAADLNQTYDRTPKTVAVATVTNELDGSALDPANWPTINVTYGGVATPPVNTTVNDGSVFIEALVDAADLTYETFSEGIGNLEIAQAVPTINIPANEVFIFDGNPQVSSATITGITGDVLGMDVEYSVQGQNNYSFTAPTALGTYDVRASYNEFQSNVNYSENYSDLTQFGTLEIISKIPIVAANITFNAPASLEYNNTAKAFTVTIDDGLNPTLPVGDVDLTYEGRNGTMYASSATAPTDAGDYTVTAMVNASNPNYTGSVAHDFSITRAAATISLNLPASNPAYLGVGQGISPFANDINESPSLNIITEYKVAGTAANTYSTTLPINAGNYDVRANLAASETNYSATEVTGTFTIDPLVINITPDPGQGREYDGLGVSGDQPISYTPSPMLLGSDMFTGDLTRVDGSAAGNYAIELGTLSAGSNYTLTLSSETFAIEPFELTVSVTANNKVYDGTTAATVGTATLDLNGAVSGDVVSLGGTPTAFDFDNANAGTNKSVTATGAYTLTGADAGNYMVAQPTLNADITPKELAVMVVANDKTYDATTTATVGAATLSGVVGSDDVSIDTTPRDFTFDNANVGMNKAVTLNGTYGLAGTAAGNYTLTQPVLSADITALSVTITPDPGQSREFDGLGVSGDQPISYTFSPVLLGSDGFTGALNRVDGSAAGNYAIELGTLSAGSNYSLNLSSEIFTINKATATVSLNNLTQTFDGTPRAVNATTDPTGLMVDFTYDGSGTVPTNAGTYAVVATINETNYQGSASGTLTVNKAAATVSLNNLTQTFDGSARTVTATTNPGNLIVDITYDGLTTAPTNAGTYAVVGTINDPNYEGSASGTLTVNQASQTITFGALAAVNQGDANFDLTATGGASGNPVTYTSSDPSIASITGNTVTIGGFGMVTITASQAGNANYVAAVDVQQTLVVNALYIWNGTSWNNGAPTVADNARIAGDYTISANGLLSVNALEITMGATMTVDNNETLTVNGVLNSEGMLHVTSGASLITHDNVMGTGYQIDRTTTFDVNTGRYSIVGSPVAASGFGVLGASAWVFGYDDAPAYEPGVTDGLNKFRTPTQLGHTEMNVGTGYFSAFTGDATGLVEFTGTPNTGTINVPLQYVDQGIPAEVPFQGFNLVSNPYPSAIEAATFLTANNTANITGSIYLWDDNNSADARGTDADYLVVNLMGNTDSRNNGAAKYDGFIRSGQGFFVQATAATSIEFNNDMRALAGNNSDGGFFREEGIQSVKLRLDNGLAGRTTVIGYAPDATTGEDIGYDARLLGGQYFGFYSLAPSGEELAIQGLPTSYEREISLGIAIPEAGEYTISLNSEESHEGLTLVFLRDNVTGEIVNLRESSYRFRTSQTGKDENRFVLQAFPGTVTNIDEDLSNQLYSYTDLGELHVMFKQLQQGPVEVMLYNLDGKVMVDDNSTIENNRWSVSTVRFPAGIYVLRVMTAEGIWTNKVMIE